jgi:hypothetical protein
MTTTDVPRTLHVAAPRRRRFDPRALPTVAAVAILAVMLVYGKLA